MRLLRHLSEALQSLASSLQSISELLPEVLQAWKIHEPLERRLAELERDRHQWEATMEAELLRSDSKYKSARAAEERTRTLESNAKALAGGDDREDDVTEQYLELLRSNADASPDAAVPQVPNSVAVNPKTRALQAKFGRG